MMNMQTCYFIRNIFIIVFVILLVVFIIFSVRTKIWNVFQKHYGFERRRELKRIRERNYEGYYSSRARRNIKNVNIDSTNLRTSKLNGNEDEKTMLLEDYIEKKSGEESKLELKKDIVITH